jgi:hypothetical protein
VCEGQSGVRRARGDLYIGSNGVLKSPTITVLKSMCAYESSSAF